MPSLTSLPIEIFYRIIRYIDPDELGEFFECFEVGPSARSCDNFTKIVEHDCVQHVKKVFFNLRILFGLLGYHRLKFLYGIPDENDEKPFSQCVELFHRLKELPRLQSVALRFAGAIENWNMSKTLECRSVVINEFMSAIAALPEPPRELIFQRFMDVNEPNPDVAEKIQNVLKNLRSLRLNLAHYSCRSPDSSTYIDETQRFFSAIPSFWLKPTFQNLEKLTLGHDDFWGYYPKLDLRGLHFPRLRILQLTRCTFVHDSQLDWILSHRNTLTELSLYVCAIVWDIKETADKEMAYLDLDSYTTRTGTRRSRYATYDKRWHDYFKSFQDLPHLRRFQYAGDEGYTPFEEEEPAELGMHQASYMLYRSKGYEEPILYREVSGRDLIFAGEWIIEDEKSLEELYAKLGYKYAIDDEEKVRRGKENLR